MAFHDLLLALFSYPDATPGDAVDRTVRVARRLGGEITALGIPVRIEAPENALAEAVLGLKSVAAKARAQSAATVRDRLARFRDDARAVGLTAFTEIEASDLYEEAELVVAHARTRDLTLTPVGPSASAGDQAVAERLLFESGRPIVVVPETGPVETENGPFGRVAIAWDGSRCASRAVADALPLLRTATEVRLLTILNDKPDAHAGCAKDLVRHLGAHGIRSHVDEVDALGRGVGATIAAYCASHDIELLVMGGYARSRAREFILGGATSDVLGRPFVPTFMSH